MGEDIKSDLAGIAITHPFFADMVTNALNYIEELEKENKELKEDNEQLDAIKNEAVRRYNFESIPVSKVKEKIEELDKRIDFLNTELTKCYIEREKLGTETDIDNNETYIFYMEEEKNFREKQEEVLQELLREE